MYWNPSQKIAEQSLLTELQRALSWDEPALFVDCVAWAKAAFIRSGVPAAALGLHLEQVAAVVRRGLPGDAGNQAWRVVVAALQAMPDLPEAQPAFLQPGAPASPLAPLYFRALLRGDPPFGSAAWCCRQWKEGSRSVTSTFTYFSQRSAKSAVCGNLMRSALPRSITARQRHSLSCHSSIRTCSGTPLQLMTTQLMRNYDRGSMEGIARPFFA